MPLLVAVCAVSELHPDGGRDRVTAIDKRALDGRVRIGRYGVGADVQADRKHHGGLDKALYAYADEDAAFWEGELGRILPPGFFGENLRTEGIDVNAARIGELWRIGASVNWLEQEYGSGSCLPNLRGVSPDPGSCDIDLTQFDLPF